MRPSHVALIGGAAAIAGATAGTTLTHAPAEAPATPGAVQALWGSPEAPRLPAKRVPGSAAWWPRKGNAILQQAGNGLAAAIARPSGTEREVVRQPFVLRVPLNDPMLLGDAPVTVTLAYALIDRHGWADARIDVQPQGARRRFQVIGARDGGGTMQFLLPADTVRAAGGVALVVTLRVRALEGGSATLVLRSVALAGG